MDNSGGRILFLEDVSEAPYRLDRYVQQLWQSGSLRGVRAIVLGTFADSVDSPPTIGPSGTPIRPVMGEEEWMRALWGPFSRMTGIPVVGCMPVGHGVERSPLPLGGRVRVKGDGRLVLGEW
jgi:muramoyltetrapeptide carboxypeptidase